MNGHLIVFLNLSENWESQQLSHLHQPRKRSRHKLNLKELLKTQCGLAQESKTPGVTDAAWGEGCVLAAFSPMQSTPHSHKEDEKGCWQWFFYGVVEHRGNTALWELHLYPAAHLSSGVKFNFRGEERPNLSPQDTGGKSHALEKTNKTKWPVQNSVHSDCAFQIEGELVTYSDQHRNDGTHLKST